jgi:predicted amidohydrolase
VLELAQPGEIVIFPEGAISGYSNDPTFLNNIDLNLLKTIHEKFRDHAKSRRIHIWAGSYVQDGKQWFNAALGYTPNGGLHQYRKINLARHERSAISPGSDLPVFELTIPGGSLQVGIQICREIRFPEQWGWLSRQGAKVIFHLNNAVNDIQNQAVWRSHLISHAASNQRYVISVNNAAAEQNCPTMVIAPDGSVLDEILSDETTTIRVQIDLEEVSDYYLDQSRQDVVRINTPDKKERRRVLRTLKLSKLQNDLDELRNNPNLFDESNLTARTEALEFIRLLEDMYALRSNDRHLKDIYQEGINLRRRLEHIDNRMFAKLRGQLIMGEITSSQLREIFDQYTDYHPDKTNKAHYGYENLDSLVAGVFLTKPEPEETLEREPGMVRYQPTPASVILELVDQVPIKPDDIFYDLGSGLGLVAILVNLLTGIRCVGIEYQPTYSLFADQIAKEFSLSGVTFLTAYVQEVDLSGGTIFYLFNPFGGLIFDTVLEKIENLAKKKTITICSYGPCTEQIAKLPWLAIKDQKTVHDFKLAVFRSKEATKMSDRF